MAKLLFLGEVPTVYVPKEEVRSWRSLIEYRQVLVAERTRIKNAIRALCRRHGVETPKGLWSKTGIQWLMNQSWTSPMVELQRDMLVQRLEGLSCMEKRATNTLNQYGYRQAGIQLLKSIPGVGDRTAEAVAAYVDEAQRFSNTKAIGCYFGLIPRQDSSAAVNRLGHITGDGEATVRKLLVEAAWTGIRCSARIRAYYQRILREDPDRKQIAIVATAHYLSRVMLAMLKTGELWREEEINAA